MWYGSLYHATCLTSICISKANANSVKDQTEMPATFKNINRILGHKKKLNQLHVLVTGHSLSLLQRLYPLNVHSCKRCLFEGKVYLTCVMGHDCLMRTYPHESHNMTVISLGQTHSLGDGSFRDQGKATP